MSTTRINPHTAAPIEWLPDHEIPAYLKAVPDWSLRWKDPLGADHLLTLCGGNRPTLLELESERRRRARERR